MMGMLVTGLSAPYPTPAIPARRAAHADPIVVLRVE